MWFYLRPCRSKGPAPPGYALGLLLRACLMVFQHLLMKDEARLVSLVPAVQLVKSLVFPSGRLLITVLFTGLGSFGKCRGVVGDIRHATEGAASSCRRVGVGLDKVGGNVEWAHSNGRAFFL
jgi:hypothetical protein